MQECNDSRTTIFESNVIFHRAVAGLRSDEDNEEFVNNIDICFFQ